MCNLGKVHPVHLIGIMVDIIQEAKEDARLEALQNFVKKFAVHIAVTLLTLFAAVGGYSYWQNSQEQASEKAALAFMSTLEGLQTASPQRQKEEVKKLFDLHGYGLLAKFIYGTSILAGKEIQTDELTHDVEALLKDKKIDAAVRDIFVVSLAHNLLNKKIVLTTLDAELNRISRANSFLRSQALEIMALNHMSSGRKDPATKLFTQIVNDANSSRASRERARILIRHLEANSERKR